MREKKYKYACYEYGFEELYTVKKIYRIYKKLVNKKAYIDFYIWNADMLRSGVFECI